MQGIDVGGGRSRWSAIGAAIAVTVGAGGFLTASAADSAPTTYVATTPCRVVDTRAGSDNVGPRSTPIGPKETFSTAFVGTVGKCNIPANAVAVVLNLAIVNPTASSYLTVFPAGGDVPLAANLNFVAGQPPASNAATVQIGGAGQLSFYNLAGTVDVTADVSGYYLPASATPPSAKTRTLVIHGADLALFDPDLYTSTSGCRTSIATSGNGGGTIALQLPVGATIGSWSVQVLDGPTSTPWSARLVRTTVAAAGASSATIYSEVAGGESNGVVSRVSSGSPGEVVDENESFFIEVNLGTNVANGLCQAKVTYTEP